MKTTQHRSLKRAAIRWLFYKRERTSVKLNREATWEEAVLEYKSFLKDHRAGKLSPRKMKEFYGTLEKLKANVQ